MVKKIEDGASLLGAGGHGRPDAFAPSAASFAPRALGNPPVDEHEPKRSLDEFHLLNDARFLTGPLQGSSTIRTSHEDVFVGVIHCLGRKRRTLVFGIPRLAANSPFAPLAWGAGRFGDVAGRRLRRCRRVLAQLGNFRFQRRKTFFQSKDNLNQLGFRKSFQLIPHTPIYRVNTPFSSAIEKNL